MVRRLSIALCLVLLSSQILLAQTIRSASGPTAADITAARDQFRLDLGGGNVAGANGSFGGLRREINWDGVPDSLSAPNSLPANFFNVNSPRGVVLSTAGTGFQVSANSGVAPVEFGNIDPSYPTQFQPFSPQRLFTPLGSNITDVTFFVPGTTNPAAVSGFGAVFTDVDVSATIQFFDLSSASMGVFPVPVSTSGGLSFLGVSGFPGGLISRVRITAGTSALAAGVTDTSVSDLVVMDDFLYSEPVADGVLVQPADVSIDKSAPASIGAGAPFNYTLLVTNNGPGVATNVVAVDTLPAGMTATSATSTQGTCVGTTAITCTVGSLNNGATATITIGTTAPASGAFANTASVSATPPDPTPGNNADTVQSTAIPRVPEQSVPTASTWALIMLATALLAGAVMRLR